MAPISLRISAVWSKPPLSTWCFHCADFPQRNNECSYIVLSIYLSANSEDRISRVAAALDMLQIIKKWHILSCESRKFVSLNPDQSTYKGIYFTIHYPAIVWYVCLKLCIRTFLKNAAGPHNDKAFILTYSLTSILSFLLFFSSWGSGTISDVDIWMGNDNLVRVSGFLHRLRSQNGNNRAFENTSISFVALCARSNQNLYALFLSLSRENVFQNMFGPSAQSDQSLNCPYKALVKPSLPPKVLWRVLFCCCRLVYKYNNNCLSHTSKDSFFSRKGSGPKTFAEIKSLSVHVNVLIHKCFRGIHCFICMFKSFPVYIFTEIQERKEKVNRRFQKQ